MWEWQTWKHGAGILTFVGISAALGIAASMLAAAPIVLVSELLWGPSTDFLTNAAAVLSIIFVPCMVGMVDRKKSEEPEIE